MVAALTNADLALCQTLHSYSAWTVVPAGGDLGCWLARSELIRKVPWTGTEFTSDGDYLNGLIQQANGRVVTVEKPLFVHN
jgi:hypothetical protein